MKTEEKQQLILLRVEFRRVGRPPTSTDVRREEDKDGGEARENRGEKEKGAAAAG